MLLCACLLSGCDLTPTHPLGSKENPIQFLFTPSIDSTQLSHNSSQFIQFLHAQTGYHFKPSVPTNYISIVESFGTNRADMAILNAFGYLLAHSKYEAIAKAIVIRDDQAFYYGQIITHVDSGINALSDISGKMFAFSDPSSLSGYLFPKKLLEVKGVIPGQIVFGMKHDIVVTMVYQRQVDAGATYHSPMKNGHVKDARARVKTQFPDISEKVKIINLTEKIPNDPIVFKKTFPEEMMSQILAAIQAYSNLPSGKKVLQAMYNIDGIIPASDDNFDNLRQTIRDSEFEVGDVVRK